MAAIRLQRQVAAVPTVVVIKDDHSAQAYLLSIAPARDISGLVNSQAEWAFALSATDDDEQGGSAFMVSSEALRRLRAGRYT